MSKLRMRMSSTRTKSIARSKRAHGMAAAGLIGVAVFTVVSPGAETASAGPARGKFVCKTTSEYGGFAPISAGPNSYIIGNCAPGTEILRTYYADQQNGPYNGGLIGGSFNGCGAVQIRNLDRVNSSESTSVCTDPGKRPPSEFLSKVDCRSGDGEPCREWDPDLAGDKTTQVVGTCQAYANYRPFSSTPTPIDPVQVISPANRPPDGNGDAQVRWRYITKDGKFVMVHDRGWRQSPGATPWVFVPAGCVTTPHAMTP